MLPVAYRRALAVSLALVLTAPEAAVGQVRAPAVVFTREPDAPRQPAWVGRAEREDRVARGAIIGALVGAGMGLVVGQAACSPCDDAAPMMAATGLGAALGAVVGFYIGWRSPGE